MFLNGAASSSRSQDWRGQISQRLFRSEVEFIAAKSREEMIRELRRAARDEVEAVISVGGDGTFNTLLQELGNSRTRFLVVPAGTANDLATELGITRKLNRAVECIRRDEVDQIDLISVNGCYMATNGGMGIIGDVAAHINAWRARIPGFRRMMSRLHHHTYSAALGGHLALGRLRFYQVHVESDGYTGDVQTPLLLVNNQGKLGGSFPVAPHTHNNDGTFNVLMFTHTSAISFIQAVYRIKQGLPVDHDPNVVSFESKEIEITSMKPTQDLRFFGDGEFIANGSTLKIKVHPKALHVFRPLSPTYEPPDVVNASNAEPNSL